MPGPPIRTDIVEVYVFRRPSAGPPGEAVFLQLLRASRLVLGGTWQPVMGHVEAGETAARAALRELAEETRITGDAVKGFWQLEVPNIYFLHRVEAMMMSPCFAVEVGEGVEPVLDESHDAARWVRRSETDRALLWPGQRGAVAQIVRDILEPGSAVEPILRVDSGSV